MSAHADTESIETATSEAGTTGDATNPSRRGLLALGGAAVLGGATGALASRAAASGGWRREQIEFDVALLGGTWRFSATVNPSDEADFKTPFITEGWIYPPGTVSDGFIATSDNAVGRWFCQGWTILDGERPEPHTSSTQTFTFGGLVEGDLFPTDTLLTSGLEGTFDESQITARAVTGGTGAYLAALGACRQTHVGVNNTIFADGTDDSAPNFTMAFDLMLPDL